MDGAGDRGWLNQCLFCDEKLSGSEFVKVSFVMCAIMSYSADAICSKIHPLLCVPQCSGVARRRLGIPSEIERNPAELCTKGDVNWLAVNGNDSLISARANSTLAP